MSDVLNEIAELKAYVMLMSDGQSKDDVHKDIFSTVQDALSQINLDYNDEKLRKQKFGDLLTRIKSEYSSNVTKTTSYPVLPELTPYPASYFAGPFGFLLPPGLNNEMTIKISPNDPSLRGGIRTYFTLAGNTDDTGSVTISGALGRIHATEVEAFNNELAHNDDDELIVLVDKDLSVGSKDLVNSRIMIYNFAPHEDKIQVCIQSKPDNTETILGCHSRDAFLFIEHVFSTEPGKEKDLKHLIRIHEIKIVVPTDPQQDIILSRVQTDYSIALPFILPSRYTHEIMCSIPDELTGIFIISDVDNVASPYKEPTFIIPSTGYMQATAMITALMYVEEIVISKIEDNIATLMDYIDDSSVYGQTIATLSQGVTKALTTSVRVEPIPLREPDEYPEGIRYVKYTAKPPEYDWQQTSGKDHPCTTNQLVYTDDFDTWKTNALAQKNIAAFGACDGEVIEGGEEVELTISSSGRYHVQQDQLGFETMKLDSNQVSVSQSPRPYDVIEHSVPFRLSFTAFPGTAVDIKSCHIDYEISSNYDSSVIQSSTDEIPDVAILPSGEVQMTWELPVVEYVSKSIEINIDHNEDGIYVREDRTFFSSAGILMAIVVDSYSLSEPPYVKVKLLGITIDGTYLAAPLNNIAILINPYDPYQDTLISMNTNSIQDLARRLDDLEQRVTMIEAHFKVTPLGIAGQLISGIASFLPMGKVFIVALLVGSSLSALASGLSGDVVGMFINIVYAMFGVMAVGYHNKGTIADKSTEWFDQLKGRVNAMLKPKKDRTLFKDAAAHFNSKYNRERADKDHMMSATHLDEGVGPLHAFGDSYVSVCHAKLGALGKDYTKYVNGNSGITGKVVKILNKQHLSPTHSDLRLQNSFNVMDGVDLLNVKVSGNIGVGSGIGDFDAGAVSFPNNHIDTTGTGIGTKFVFTKQEQLATGMTEEVMLRLNPSHPTVTNEMLGDEFSYYFKLSHPADYDPHVVDIIIETQTPWSNPDWKDVYDEGFRIAKKMNAHSPMVPDLKRTAEIDMSPDNIATIIKSYGEDYRRDYFEYDVLRNNCHMTSSAMFECITKLTPSGKLPEEFDREWLRSMNQRLINGRQNYKLNEAIQISEIYALMGAFFKSNRNTLPKAHGYEDNFSSEGKGARVKRACLDAAFDLSSLYV